MRNRCFSQKGQRQGPNRAASQRALWSCVKMWYTNMPGMNIALLFPFRLTVTRAAATPQSPQQGRRCSLAHCTATCGSSTHTAARTGCRGSSGTGCSGCPGQVKHDFNDIISIITWSASLMSCLNLSATAMQVRVQPGCHWFMAWRSISITPAFSPVWP